jgi:methionyl-tRNA formyltransferase
MKNNPNFVFFGTPNVASETLEILKENGYLPSLIITSTDKPAGRGLHLTPTPVSIWAQKNNIECLKPEKITPEFISQLSQPKDFPMASHRKVLWQLFIVVAYGKILPEELINLPELGTINIHYSLLPKYRGASPLEACLLNGDEKTGVSIQQMAFKLDSGPILAEKEIPISLEETKDGLREKLIRLGAETLAEVLPKIINKEITPKIQDGAEATFCKKIKKEDGLLDLNGDAKENYNKYRAFAGWPGTYFFKDKKRIKITKAKYENDSFIIERVIPEGKKEIDFSILK